jgi:anti-sigma B factor antagonist
MKTAMSTPSYVNWLEVEQIGDVIAAKFTQPSIVEEKAIRAVGEQLSNLAEHADLRHVVLNFGSVTRLSSTMLAKLVTFNRKLAAAGASLALCGIHPDVKEVFEMTQLTRLFRIYPNEQEALQSF